MVLDATKELKWNWYMWLAAALLETEDPRCGIAGGEKALSSSHFPISQAIHLAPALKWGLMSMAGHAGGMK